MKRDLSELTIVIPTLPKNYPRTWIQQLKSYITFGVQVIIILPMGYETKILPNDLANIPNVQVCVADSIGQVTQRIFGFCKADTVYVMQMDDDIYLDVDSLVQLIDAFKNLESNSTLAPRLLAKEVNVTLQSNPDWRSIRGIYRQICARILHGLPWLNSPSGCITPSGYGYTYSSHRVDADPSPAEWLPGGCILHHRNNLILEPFYPFSGKAYVEDLIHSFYLRQKGIKMYYLLSVSALTPAPDKKQLDIDPAELFLDFRARKYYVELIGGSLSRMKIIYIFKAIKISIILISSILIK